MCMCMYMCTYTHPHKVSIISSGREGSGVACCVYTRQNAKKKRMLMRAHAIRVLEFRGYTNWGTWNMSGLNTVEVISVFLSDYCVFIQYFFYSISLYFSVFYFSIFY